MALIDLTAQGTVKTSYTEDIGTGFTTVTFKDVSDVQLGQLRIETLKYRSLLAALGIVSRELFDVTQPGQVGQRTSLDINALLAVTVFG